MRGPVVLIVSTSRLTTPLLSAIVLFTTLGATDLPAREFDKLNGAWAGAGTVQHADGTKERLRCRALYQPSGAMLAMRLTCASDSYKFELQSSLTSRGGELSGTWFESTRNLQGSLTGSVEGDLFRISAVGPGFTANVAVRTSSASQNVTIQSPGSSISNVNISLRK